MIYSYYGDDPTIYPDLIPTEPTTTTEGILASAQLTWENGLTSDIFNSAYQNSVFNTMFESFWGTQDKKPHPSTKKLTEQQAKESGFYHPGMDVSGGITEHQLIRQSQEYNHKQVLQLTVNNMPDTFAAQAAKTGANLAVEYANPIVIGSFGVAGKVGEKLLSPYIEGISDRLVKRMATLSSGAFEGALASVPITAASYIKNPDIERSQVIHMAFMNMALSAGIRGFTGYAKPFTPDDIKKNAQTALNQMINGKITNLDKVLQQQYYKNRTFINEGFRPSNATDQLEALVKNNLTTENLTQSQRQELENHLESIYKEREVNKLNKPTIKKLNTDINQLNFERNQLKKEASANKKNKRLLSEKKRLETKKKLEAIEKEIKEKQSKLDKNKDFQQIKKALKSFKQNQLPSSLNKFAEKYNINLDDYYQQLEKELSENSHESAEQQAQAFVNELIERIENDQKDIERFIENTTEFTEQDLKAPYAPQVAVNYFDDYFELDMEKPVLNSTKKLLTGDLPDYLKKYGDLLVKNDANSLIDINEFDEIARGLNRIDEMGASDFTESMRKSLTNREKEIKQLDKKYGRHSETIKLYQQLEARKRVFQRALKDSDAVKYFINNKGEPINKSDLAQQGENLESYQSNIDVNQMDINTYDAETQAIENTSFEDITPSEFMQNYDLSRLPDEVRAQIENIDEEIKRGGELKEAFSDYEKCALGGEGG